MSNIYIQEPPTNGKVLLKTTAGEIDIELWSKEAPRACRNFVQLCLEGYYDNTIFHRVVPDFIIQGGDPTGTGTGGESVYGKPFRDEFHSRLRFNRRGLVAMANAGPHDNGSQFFFTLGRADELNNKHTILGKVTGDTIYNILRLAEVDIGEDERPVNPHKIKTTEVLFNPFDDIVPRIIKKSKKEKEEEEEAKKTKAKGTKNFNLLSFGEEAEEDEEEVNEVSKVMRGKSKSSHDLLKDDPGLSSVPAVDRTKDSPRSDSDTNEDEPSDEDDDVDSDEKQQIKDRISNKLRKDPSKTIKQAAKSEETDEKKSSRSEELRKEARQLKRELKAAKEKKENDIKESETAKEAENTVTNSALEEYLKEKEKYEELRKKNSNKGVSREQQTLALLDRFKSKLTQAITEPPKEEEVSNIDEDNDEGWLSHVLQFEEKSTKVKDANMQDEDTFEIYDPRNPVNKRRREESKKLMKQKKERR
ncbi:hypothetical protein XENTR_v10002888 [Xenopus tropicalis]|uniref:Spliceosome-associated protein CWC27 homolog n=1 Tax=Xenopus tropicalis TaxID=8364 RepID=F6YQ98_XENTR|nr:spliceosome-associated protein CWC27 homolog [Xenopus tropicalis]KAE8636212.1 hypothetical protein XENTR_v10002888 [Xenopus tropicalis]KAE8636213.1 hypothetical protein XENTR_v10002888 [Xenopus tropicalis]